MSTEKLKMLKDNQGNVFEFAIAGISYCDGLQEALDLKAVDDDVVHLDKTEIITGYKTFSNGLTASGTTTVNALEVTGNQSNDGTLEVDGTITGNTNIISKGTVQSRRTSYPLVGAMRVDSNGDQTGYAKLEVDNANKLMLVCAAESGSSDTKVIRYANSQYEFYGAAESVIDYGNTSRRLKIGYSGTSLTECTYLAAYGTTSDGDNVIKDIKCEDVTVGNATNSTMATTVKDYGHTSSSSSNEGIMIGWGGSSMTEAEYLAVYHYNSTTHQAYIKDMNITNAYHLSLSGRTLGLNFGSSTVISCGTVTLPGTDVVFNQVGTDTNTLYCV